jgi:hypothetical protein
MLLTVLRAQLERKLSDSEKFIETLLRFKSVSGFFLASTGLANFLFFVTPRGLQE